VQHAVPKQVNERECFDAIALNKDVDGVTSLGYERMALGEPAYRSATPDGIMTMLKHYGIESESPSATRRPSIFRRSSTALMLSSEP
jgi:methylenetetrahydrofolate dehydrogenase (NADP+)/methenyltetrahydrofolate cyclohydrolase